MLDTQPRGTKRLWRHTMSPGFPGGGLGYGNAPARRPADFIWSALRLPQAFGT